MRTHYNNILQQKLGAITNFQDPYLRITSNINLSPTQSPNIKILFKHGFCSGTQTELNIQEHVIELIGLPNNMSTKKET